MNHDGNVLQTDEVERFAPPHPMLRNYIIVRNDSPSNPIHEVEMMFRIADEDAYENATFRKSSPITAYDLTHWVREWYTRPIVSGDRLQEVLTWSSQHDEIEKMKMLCDHFNGRRSFRHCDLYCPTTVVNGPKEGEGDDDDRIRFHMNCIIESHLSPTYAIRNIAQ